MSVSFSKSARAQNSLNFVMEWTHALTSSGSIPCALNTLMQLINADAALIARTLKRERQIKYVFRCCRQEGKVWPSQPQSHLDRILGDYTATAKAGSVWQLSDTMAADETTASPRLGSNPSGAVEVIVIPLESATGHLDHLELHYRHQPTQLDLDLLNLMSLTLACCWSKRTPGSISSNLDKGRKHLLREVQDNDYVPVLDPQNPAGLSRCEFRICAMMKEGMTVKKVSEALTVCPTTVRSHLSSIFSKTDVSNQVELLHLLNRQAA